MRRGARAALLICWLLALAGLGWMVSQRLHVSTDLRSFMPAPTTPDQRLLMEQVGEGPGSRLLLLSIAGQPDASLAALEPGPRRRVEKRPALQPGHQRQLRSGRAGSRPAALSLPVVADAGHATAGRGVSGRTTATALDDLSSPAASLLKTLLPRDPTLEVLKLAQLWAPAKSPEVREGVWFSPQDEALLLVQTVAAGFDPGAQQAAIAGIQRAFQALPGSAGAKLELSGPGYFSVVLGAQTRHQADWIGRISTVGFIALLLLAYRSVSSLLLSALPIASAALAGIAALTLVYPQVHGITLAFGFTLLGVAQEYPIRVLSHRRAGEDAVHSVRALWPLLLTAIASACIAYLAFYASGVHGLQQLAVFTIVGLLVAGFSTRYALVYLLPRRVHDVADMRWLARARELVDRLPRPRWIPVLVAVVIGLYARVCARPILAKQPRRVDPAAHLDAAARRAFARSVGGAGCALSAGAAGAHRTRRIGVVGKTATARRGAGGQPCRRCAGVAVPLSATGRLAAPAAGAIAGSCALATCVAHGAARSAVSCRHLRAVCR